MQFRSALLIFALFFSSPLVSAISIGSIISDVTSGAGDATSVAGSLAGAATGVFETVTSVGGTVETIVTSAGGKAFTVAASDATVVASDITSFFNHATATAASHSNAASHMGALTPLCTSVVTVLAGISLGAWAIL